MRVEPLLNDAEKVEPEMMQKLRKENRIPRERKNQGAAQKEDGEKTRKIEFNFYEKFNYKLLLKNLIKLNFQVFLNIVQKAYQNLC